MNEFDINSALGSSDGGYEVSEPTNGWGDGWGEDGSAKVERDRLEYKDGEFYNAHIIEWSFKDLDQIEGKAPKRILDFYLRIHWQNEAGESVTIMPGCVASG